MEAIQLLNTDELCDKILAQLEKRFSFLQLPAASDNDIGDMVNLDRAAAILDISKYTLYGLTSRGEIPFFKRGKRLYFSKKALEQWISKPKKL